MTILALGMRQLMAQTREKLTEAELFKMTDIELIRKLRMNAVYLPVVQRLYKMDYQTQQFSAVEACPRGVRYARYRDIKDRSAAPLYVDDLGNIVRAEKCEAAANLLKKLKKRPYIFPINPPSP